MNDHVHEAADDGAERAGGDEPEERRNRIRDRGAGHDGARSRPRGSSGGGHSVDDSESCTRPFDQRERHAGRIERHRPRRTRARTSAAQSSGAAPVRRA